MPIGPYTPDILTNIINVHWGGKALWVFWLSGGAYVPYGMGVREPVYKYFMSMTDIGPYINAGSPPPFNYDDVFDATPWKTIPATPAQIEAAAGADYWESVNSGIVFVPTYESEGSFFLKAIDKDGKIRWTTDISAFTTKFLPDRMYRGPVNPSAGLPDAGVETVLLSVSDSNDGNVYVLVRWRGRNGDGPLVSSIPGVPGSGEAEQGFVVSNTNKCDIQSSGYVGVSINTGEIVKHAEILGPNNVTHATYFIRELPAGVDQPEIVEKGNVDHGFDYGARKPKV